MCLPVQTSSGCVAFLPEWQKSTGLTPETMECVILWDLGFLHAFLDFNLFLHDPDVH